MDRLTAMSAFCTVAECESFSAAARRLGMSTARVSKLIAQLEGHLGVRLLERTTRRVRLTEAGNLYYQRSRPLLDELDDADASVVDFSGQISGRIRISVPEFGMDRLAASLPELLAKHPKLDLEVQYSSRFVDLHSEGFDLAVRIGQLQDSSLVAKQLATVNLVACASPAYLDQHGTPSSPSELSAHNCLLYTHAAQPQNWTFRIGEQWQDIRVNGNLRSNNGQAMVEAARAGLGIVNKPLFMVAEDLRRGTLKRLFDEYPGAEISVVAVYPHRRSLSTKVQLIIEFLQQQIGDPPFWEQT